MWLEAGALMSDDVGGVVLGQTSHGERQRYATAVATMNDAKLAAQYARVLDSLADAPQPAGRILYGEGLLTRARRVGLLAGSFNPLTRAHIALAEAARVAGRLEMILWTFSVSTVDKERVERASLVDRLLQMSAYLHDGPDAMALLNRGLYVEQVSVVSRMFPHLEELVVVVGFDKVVQILDPRYYEDRDAVLDRLFASASLLVAPRLDEDEASLVSLLASEENKKYQAHIAFCPLPRRFLGDSSSMARAIVGESRTDRRLRALLPPEGRALAIATGAYSRLSQGSSQGQQQIDLYKERQSAIAMLASLEPERETDTLRLDTIIAKRLATPDRPG